MKIKTQFIIPQEGIDQDRNKVPAHKDTVALRSLDEAEQETPQEEQGAIEEFLQDVGKFQGYIAINENFETAYIPPYDDIAAVIRHKLKGDEFVIIDLSKADKNAFIQALRVNEDTEV